MLCKISARASVNNARLAGSPAFSASLIRMTIAKLDEINLFQLVHARPVILLDATALPVELRSFEVIDDIVT